MADRDLRTDQSSEIEEIVDDPGPVEVPVPTVPAADGLELG